MLVKGHRKHHIVEEDELKDKIGNYDTWEENNIIMAWIMNSVYPHVSSQLCYYDTTKHMLVSA